MRKILGILLLASLLLPLGGTWIWLKHHRSQIRQEVKTMLKGGADKKELVELAFSLEDADAKLHWEHSGEFEFDDQMYDVVESEVKGDSIFYLCWWDHAETRVKKNLERLLAGQWQQDPLKKNGQKRLLDFYKSLYLLETVSADFILPLSGNTPAFREQYYHSPEQVPLSPPPRFILS
ncbi:MAG: hypothetical protein GYB31_04055 [Bacteroidetes bacterium]|nr:hypothetical protein [Bacteroidota bacterium]